MYVLFGNYTWNSPNFWHNDLFHSVLFVTVSEWSTRRVLCRSKQKEGWGYPRYSKLKSLKFRPGTIHKIITNKLLLFHHSFQSNYSLGNNLIDLIRSIHLQNCNFLKLVKFSKTPFLTEHRTTASVHYWISNQSFISCVYKNLSV